MGPATAGRFERGEHRFHVEACRREQRLGQRFAVGERRGRIPGEPFFFDQLSHKAVAVGMHARRRQPDQHVARDNVGAWQNLVALDGADAEAREIIVGIAVQARHFRRLAADQRAAALAATLRDTGNDAAGVVDVEFSGGEIVEKEQRLGALDDQIVDAHGHKIDADRIVQPGIDGNLQLRANAVIGRNQDRIAKAGRLQVKQPAKPAEISVRPRPPRRLHQRFDGSHQRIARIDVDPRISIGGGGVAARGSGWGFGGGHEGNNSLNTASSFGERGFFALSYLVIKVGGYSRSMNMSSCPSGGCREMWPLPVVSSARTALPAATRRTSPSLVSNSTSPVSQITSLRRAGLCQPTSHMPDGTRQKLHPDAANVSDSRSGRLSLKTCFGCSEKSTCCIWVSPRSSA